MIQNTREIAAEYRLSYWSGIIKERGESGKSIKAYCESVGIRTNVYFYWQRKLREAACEHMQNSLNVKGALLAVPNTSKSNAETAIVPSGWAVCDVAESGSGEETITIEIGKCRILATACVNPESLSKICKVLMSLC